VTARKLIEFGAYRIVRVHLGFSVLEVRDGGDWLGVARWKCAAQDNKSWRRLTVEGKSDEWVKAEWLRDLLNDLGDAMMREKKRGRGKRKGGWS